MNQEYIEYSIIRVSVSGATCTETIYIYISVCMTVKPRGRLATRDPRPLTHTTPSVVSTTPQLAATALFI